ncbi:YfbU family protein [Aliivibrio sifiae]|uniref:YfbU family protein n=1 Tax=Aliivibrio fischeri TaxID=668 RepID=UPI0012DA2BB3|nr:YfbU family protein [Aliivibrio fischeri]MUJ27925.1 YfbU family protein [Aliivibrio fischeri]
MKLDKKERLALVNQFLILEKLYPNDAEYYAQHRQAIVEGYELHYDWIYGDLWEGLSKDECRKVLDILDMYRVIHFSSLKCNDTQVQDHSWLKFAGFDGNEESSYMAYCRYLIVDIERFNELKYGLEIPDLNSHMPTIEKYQAMLDVWKGLGKPHTLSADKILSILEAR